MEQREFTLEAFSDPASVRDVVRGKSNLLSLLRASNPHAGNAEKLQEGYLKMD